MTDWSEQPGWFEPILEFCCPGCGRSMVTFCGLRMDPAVCGACLAQPGWTDYPPMVRALDPDNDRDRSAVTMTVSEIECRAAWITATLGWLRLRSSIVEDYRPPEPLEQRWYPRLH